MKMFKYSVKMCSSYFTVGTKYSIPALRDDYTIQQLERIVQNELNEMNGGEEHAND